MRLFKVFHIPTGLFWKPSTHSNKKNLSKTGKVYHTKPAIESWLHQSGCLSYTDYRKKKTSWGMTEEAYQVPTSLKDWKIVELDLSPNLSS